MKDNPFQRILILHCRNADCNAVLTPYELERGKQFCIDCRKHNIKIQIVKCIKCQVKLERGFNVMITPKYCKKCKLELRREYHRMIESTRYNDPIRPCLFPGCQNLVERSMNGRMYRKYCGVRHNRKMFKLRRSDDIECAANLAVHIVSGTKLSPVKAVPIVVSIGKSKTKMKTV